MQNIETLTDVELDELEAVIRRRLDEKLQWEDPSEIDVMDHVEFEQLADIRSERAQRDANRRYTSPAPLTHQIGG